MSTFIHITLVRKELLTTFSRIRMDKENVAKFERPIDADEIVAFIKGVTYYGGKNKISYSLPSLHLRGKISS